MRKSKLVELTQSGDIEQIRAAIRQKYGFEAPDAYIADLIAFVNAMLEKAEHAR